MTDHVYRRFPNQIEAIKALFKKSSTFREICADYEELSAWLDEYYRSEGLPSEKCNHAREVIRNLEVEITEALRIAEF